MPATPSERNSTKKRTFRSKSSETTAASSPKSLTWSRSRSKSSSLRRSRSKSRSGKKLRASTANDSGGETLKRTTSRRYVYSANGLDDPVINETLDLSSQGLTVISNTITNNKTVNQLDVSTNNIRTFPPDVINLQALVYLDISRNAIQCQHARDTTGLPSELSHIRTLRVLILSECNLVYVPPVVWNCVSLLALDVSRNHIGRLSREVSQLKSLRYLNVQQAGLHAIPAEIAYCRQLSHLLLWGNSIRSLPQSLKYLTELRRLELTCRSFAVGLDSYMNNLLMTGQIQSEHIPSVLFQLPGIEQLDLEHTKINILSEKCCLTSLRRFYLANNFLKTIPSEILNMTSLVMLDVSSNLLTNIPHDIDKLIKLESLSLNNNKITICPSSIGNLCRLSKLALNGNRIRQLPAEIGQLQRLKCLSLEDNLIENLPSTIGNLTQLDTLILSNNRLERLPVEVCRMTSLLSAHSYRKLKKHGLWLHPNELLYDPPDTIWRTGNTMHLFRHLGRQEVLRLAAEIYRQKLIVIGTCDSGKTTLVDGLTSVGELMTSSDSNWTIRLKQWTTSNNIRFIVYDISGCESIQVVLPVLFDQSALYLIVFNVSTVVADNFQQHIGRWLDLVMTYVPDAVVKLIGTHWDLCGDVTSLDERCQCIYQLTTAHVSHRIEQLNKVRECIQVKSDDKLIQIVEQIDIIDSRSVTDIQSLITQLELAVTDRRFFHQRVTIKDITHQSLELSKLLRQVHTGPFVDWDDVIQVGATVGLSMDSIQQVVSRLSSVGHVNWCPACPNIIITRPTVVINYLQRCFRRTNDPHFNRQDIFHAVSSSSQNFADIKDLFLSTGQSSRQFIASLLFDLKLKHGDYDVIMETLKRLDLCYVTSDVTSETVVFPSYCHLRSSNDTNISLDMTRYSFISATHVLLNVFYPPYFMTRFACRLAATLNNKPLLATDDVIVADVGDDVRLVCKMYRNEGRNQRGNVAAELFIEVGSCRENSLREVKVLVVNDACSLLRLYQGILFTVSTHT